MTPTNEKRNARVKHATEEESNIIAALDALVNPAASGFRRRSRLATLQHVLADLTGIPTAPKPRLVDKKLKKTHSEAAAELRRNIAGVIQQLRQFILENKLCGEGENLHRRKTVLKIVYEKLSGTPWRTNASATPSDNSTMPSSPDSALASSPPVTFPSAPKTSFILPIQMFSLEARKVLEEMLPDVYPQFFIPVLFPTDRFHFFRNQVQ